jgi:hypothetical protein
MIPQARDLPPRAIFHYQFGNAIIANSPAKRFLIEKNTMTSMNGKLPTPYSVRASC